MNANQYKSSTLTGDIDLDRFLETVPSKSEIIEKLNRLDGQKKFLTKLLRLASSVPPSTRKQNREVAHV